ncbi:MAG TPA: PrsW family intramembrane metalloprotease [Candidatus Humimicrobiaceae bacterium]|nr:PrsW family intramembrane metalloprotease [Candidatus Humimicrobiaceae bacterium]
MYYFFLIIFALLPSFIWLLFFLRKDAHPESNQMILRVFLYGMLVTIPAAILSLGFLEVTEKLSCSPFLILILNIFVGVALIEEFSKYLVVKASVLRSSELDEPLDVMLYMIIAALGFAALENILYLFRIYFFPPTDIVCPVFLTNVIHFLSVVFGGTFSGDIFYAVFLTNIFRFLGAVFGHALWSGILGYFLALSFYDPKQRLRLLIQGLVSAAALHAAFNYVIMQAAETENLIWFLLIIIMLAGLAIFITLGFKRLKKMKSICKIR